MTTNNDFNDYEEFTNTTLSEDVLEGLQENQIEFLNAYAMTALNVKRACESVNVSRTTFYHWLNTSNTFAVAVHDLKEGLKDDVESVMAKMMASGNERLLIHFSKTKMKERGYVEGVAKDVDDDYESEFMRAITKKLKKQESDKT